MSNLTTILGIPAHEIENNIFEIKLRNGDKIKVQKISKNEYIINESKYSFSFNTAHRYIRTLIQEKETGIRYIYHPKGTPPEICGVNGSACRNLECNSALCNCCPIAEQYFANKDNVRLEYLTII